MLGLSRAGSGAAEEPQKFPDQVAGTVRAPRLPASLNGRLHHDMSRFWANASQPRPAVEHLAATAHLTQDASDQGRLVAQ